MRKGELTLQKYMNAERGRLGALGSFSLVAFFEPLTVFSDAFSAALRCSNNVSTSIESIEVALDEDRTHTLGFASLGI